MGQFLGFVPLGQSWEFRALLRDAGNTPGEPSGTAAYRVYGPLGLVAAGTLAQKDTGTITSASGSAPVTIASPAHGLTDGAHVTLPSGSGLVTVVDADHFQVAGCSSSGNTSGSWHATGLYGATVACTQAGGYAAGVTYSLVVTASVGGAVRGDLSTFTVV